MKRRQIDIQVKTTGSRAAVYALLADHTTWADWSAIDEVTLEREGAPPPGGVGAIRVNKRGRTTGRDEITALDADRHFAYISLSGLPIEDYRASVDLDDEAGGGGGTRIHWRASFEPKYPGTGRLVERGIRDFLQQCADGLAEAAAGK